MFYIQLKPAMPPKPSTDMNQPDNKGKGPRFASDSSSSGTSGGQDSSDGSSSSSGAMLALGAVAAGVAVVGAIVLARKRD